MSSGGGGESTSSHDVVVVGNGPIGSAVARHVAEGGASVLVVDGRGSLTSASDDVGRIVRPLDAEGREGWTKWNVASIEAFAAIEEATGVKFFQRCGSLACGTPPFVEKPAVRLTEAGVPFESLDSGDAVSAKFPFLSVPDTHVAVSDDSGGFVDPHRMIEAQNILMRRATPTSTTTTTSSKKNAVTMETAVALNVVAAAAADDDDGGKEKEEEEKKIGAVVETKQGGKHRGRVVVLAGGSYTAWLAAVSGLTTIAPPPATDAATATATATAAASVSPDARSGVGSIRLSRRTVLLAEVTEAEAKGMLEGMPTVKYQFAPPPPQDNESDPPSGGGGGGDNSHSRNEAMSVYVLPPIKYPGPDPPPGWYVKIGGGANDFFERERWGDTVDDLDAWMKSDGDEVVADRLHDVLLSLMPRVNFLSLTPKPCVTTCTDDGELQCDVLGDGTVIAVGGCQGKAAGPADAIGRAVAKEVERRLASSSSSS